MSSKRNQFKGTCHRCGNSDPRVLLTHHLVPKSKGGTDAPSNKIKLCANYHQIMHHEGMNTELDTVRIKAGDLFERVYEEMKIASNIGGVR